MIFGQFMLNRIIWNFPVILCSWMSFECPKWLYSCEIRILAKCWWAWTFNSCTTNFTPCSYDVPFPKTTWPLEKKPLGLTYDLPKCFFVKIWGFYSWIIYAIHWRLSSWICCSPFLDHFGTWVSRANAAVCHRWLFK